MGQAEPHQNIELLQAFGLGKVGHVAAETIARHLETCVACRAVVANASADNFLADLQRVAAQPAGPSPEAVPEAAGRSGHPTAAVSSPAGLERHGARPLHRAPAGGDPIPPALAASPDYEVIREINRGGMGIVYLVRNRRMDRLEGLKVVKEVLLQRTGASERFEREMRSAARLSHPNIVTAYSSPPLVGLLAFAMEYVDGIDLHQLVKTQGPLPVSNACYYVYQAAQGLQHAHERKMVHRDIKPNNLMLTRDGKKQVIKILDFGLAKATKENPIDAGLTGEGQMLGTPSYMAPEQIISAATADIRADIYSLGCTLYYLLTGNPPFKDKQGLYQILQAHQSEAARPLNELRPEVPGELAGIVARMIAKDPAQRFQQPSEIAQGLTPFFKRGVKPISVPSNSSGSHSPPPRPIPASPEAQDTDSPRDTNAFQVPEPAAAPPAAAGGNPEASPIQTMVELIGNPADSPTAARADRARQERRRRKAQVLWTGVAVGGLGLTFMLLWAGGVFSDGKLKSKKSKRPDSTASLPIDKHRPAAPAVGEFKDIKTRASSPITPEGDPVVAQTSPAASVPPTEVAEVHEAAAAKGGGLPIDGNRPLEILHGEPIITNAVGMKLALIPAGEFQMGYEQSPEELARIYPYATKEWFTSGTRRHRVRISKPFYLALHEVTVGEFRQFVSDRAYETDAEKDPQGSWGYDPKAGNFVGPRTDFTWNNPGFPQTDEHPIVYISWNDAQAFCRWLSDRDGARYRLPTEAEWEYACRAGTETLYQHGDDPQGLPATGNAWDEDVRKRFFNPVEPLLPNDGFIFTAPVGRFQANAFGLFDMHGNAWEWCSDFYLADYYRVSPVDDPRGPSRGAERVMRGGAWDKFGAHCGSAFRTGKQRSDKGYNTGFRVARNAG